MHAEVHAFRNPFRYRDATSPIRKRADSRSENETISTKKAVLATHGTDGSIVQIYANLCGSLQTDGHARAPGKESVHHCKVHHADAKQNACKACTKRQNICKRIDMQLSRFHRSAINRKSTEFLEMIGKGCHTDVEAVMCSAVK